MRRVPVVVPDLGGASARAVALLVGNEAVSRGQALVTLETDKATADLESDYSGALSWAITVGQSLKAGDVVAYIETDDPDVSEQVHAAAAAAASPAPEPVPKAVAAVAPAVPALVTSQRGSSAAVYAGPGVRFIARQLGVDLAAVTGSGRAGRVLTEDLYAYVKNRLQQPVGVGAYVPAPELPDFASFGPVTRQALSQLEWRTGQLTYRAWAAIPQVTHHAEADITELETRRKRMRYPGVKVTLLPYLIQAVVAALKEFPRVNASLSADGRELILKQYYHVALAVETERGLVVPVLRNCDRMDTVELARAAQAAAERARSGKLALNELSGGCITISSLGHIGGIGFSPIVREPEVAIVGVSRARIQPLWSAATETFVPRMVLPFSLSYDHRVIDGALAARFCEHMAAHLTQAEI